MYETFVLFHNSRSVELRTDPTTNYFYPSNMPSMAEFGEREPKLTPRAGKKMLGSADRPLSPSRLHRAKGRDTLLEEELKHLAAGAKGEDFLHMGLERSEAPVKGKAKVMDRDLNSHVFDGPQLDRVRPQRIRPDFSQEALAALKPVDTRKDDAAKVMASDGDLISKMYACNYPLPRRTDEVHRRKKSIKPIGSELGSEVEPAGFHGMGARSKPEAHRGVSTKPVEKFVISAADIPPPPRVGGKRMVRNDDVTGPIGSARVGSNVFPSAEGTGSKFW